MAAIAFWEWAVKLTSWWAMPLLAAMVGATLSIAGPAGAAAPLARTGQAATLSNHQISGTETGIACMTAARCVAVGYGPHSGQVVSLDNGKQVRVTALALKAHLTSVSCAGKAGCWAVGPRPGGVVLVKIGPAGNVISEVRQTVPGKKVESTEISCASISSCEIFATLNIGTATAVQPLYLASWNGTKWSLRTFGGYGDAPSYVNGFACWLPTCVVLGSADSGSVYYGPFAWIFNNGNAGTFVGDADNTAHFYADSCVSLTTCWVVGISHGAGIVVTLKDGVLGPYEAEPDVMTGVECEFSKCEAVGGDILLTVSHGVVTGAPVTDTATTGFTDISYRGTGFAAVGGAHKSGYSEVVTG